MSVVDRKDAGVPPRRDSGGSSLSSLLGSILDTVRPQSIALPDVAGGDDLRIYHQRLNNLLRGAEVPENLDERKRRGRELRFRAINVLEQLGSIGTSTRPTTAGQWRRLCTLAKFCARDQDWCSSTGPVIGATGDKLREKLAVMNLRDVFDPLIAAGFIVPHRPRGNGRRHFAVINANTAYERVDASGWSLAPLMFILDELELLYQHEAELLSERCLLPKTANKALADARRALKPHLSSQWAQELWGEALRIGRRINDARKGRLEKLRASERDATELRILVESTVDNLGCDGQSGTISYALSGETIPDIYDSKNPVVISNCSAGRRSEERDLPPSPQPLTEPSGDPSPLDDPFGIERSGFQLSEAPTLFPFSNGLIDLTRMTPEAGAYSAARLMSVAHSSVTRSAGQIGLAPTLLCLLITGQHASDGEIRSTPDIYFQGLIKKARKGDLNIGHTIFGRRAKGAAQRSLTSKINQVRTDLCYG